MKRLSLILFVWTAVALSAAAAYNLTASKVTVDDLTVDKDNFFITVEAHTSSGEYEVAFDVWPASHSAIGAFSSADKTISYISSYVHKTKADGETVDMWYNCASDADITLTITQKDETTCTLSGSIQATRKGTTYTYNIANFDFAYAESGEGTEPEKDPYRFEPETATTVDFIADVVAFKQKTGFINITLNEIEHETYDWIELNLLSDELTWPAGSYAINNSGNQGTLTASKGYLGAQNDDPCYVAVRDKDAWGQYTPYYLESGTIVVSYNQKTDSIFVTGQAISHNGSTVNINVRSYNMLYDPDEAPKEPEFVTLTIDSVVVTYMREESDAEKEEYHYSLNFFNKASDADGYPNVLVDIVLNKEMELVDGTFSLADNQLSGVALFQNQSDFNSYFFGYPPYVFTTVTLTLKPADNGKWTYSMFLSDEIGSEYSFSLTQAPHIINYPQEGEEMDAKDKPFKDEQNALVELSFLLDSIRWIDSSVPKDGILDIILMQRQLDTDGLRPVLHLGFYTPVTAVPAGTYPVNATEADFTFSASLGRYGNVLIPCYAALMDNNNWAHAVWYIVDGMVTLSYEDGIPVLSGCCKTHFGSTIHFTYQDNASMESVATANGQPPTEKVLHNGRLLIRRNNHLYTVTGTMIQ